MRGGKGLAERGTQGTWVLTWGWGQLCTTGAVSHPCSTHEMSSLVSQHFQPWLKGSLGLTSEMEPGESRSFWAESVTSLLAAAPKMGASQELVQGRFNYSFEVSQELAGVVLGPC